MRMKMRFLALALLWMALPASAQQKVDTAQLNAAVETQRQITEAQRQQIVMQNVQLTGAESEEFWPTYREYRADVANINDRMVALIAAYAESYETLGDKESMAILRG